MAGDVSPVAMFFMKLQALSNSTKIQAKLLPKSLPWTLLFIQSKKMMEKIHLPVDGFHPSTRIRGEKGLKKSIYKYMNFIYLPVDGFYPFTTKFLSKVLNMEPQLSKNICGIFAPLVNAVIFCKYLRKYLRYFYHCYFLHHI